MTERGKCGKCDLFMRDRQTPELGACGRLDADNVASGTYWWTTVDGDCPEWTPRSTVPVTGGHMRDREPVAEGRGAVSAARQVEP